MARKDKNKGTVDDPSGQPVAFDLRELYRFDPKEALPDITTVRYSNLAYIQVTPRDVYIDFLEMPGVKREGRAVVNGTRVYMSFVAARRLSEVLKDILERAHAQGAMEEYGSSVAERAEPKTR
jgi:hypothetical protein